MIESTFMNISFGLGLSAGLVLSVVIQALVRVAVTLWRRRAKDGRFFPA
jgi:hypothetical protein